MSGLASVGPEIDGLDYIGRLGEGGYADVYLYERQWPRLKLAIKVLREGTWSKHQQRQFEAEAEVMAELADHPHIVQVISTGVTTDGRPYLVMRFYPENLAQRVHNNPMNLAGALRSCIQVSSAVESVHLGGIVEGVIKPANILLSPFGVPALTDFGIAGRAREANPEEDFGVSVPWTAPEVLSHQSDGSVAADVYSLTATLWHLLVGRSPFEIPEGDNSLEAIYGRVLHLAPPATGRADVPERLERLLLQGLSKDPGTRPGTALEFIRGLQSAERGEQLTPTPAVVPQAGETPTALLEHDSDPDRTVNRLSRVSPGHGVPPSGHRGEPTVVRPHGVRARPADASAREETSDLGARAASSGDLQGERAGSSRAGWYVAAAAVLLAIGGYAVFHRGSDQAPEQTTQLHARNTSIVVVPGTPEVAARRESSGSEVQFTWQYARHRPGDTFLWRTQGGGPAHRVSLPRVTVHANNTGRICIAVKVDRANGQVSPWSEFTCA